MVAAENYDGSYQGGLAGGGCVKQHKGKVPRTVKGPLRSRDQGGPRDGDGYPRREGEGRETDTLSVRACEMNE